MIRKIEAQKPVKRKKVAAYARVSMETERLNHSLAAQIDYYSSFIQSNPEWEYVDVYFEKERISTLSAEGELMLTLLASFAQEESRSISDNVKWSIRKRMEQGISTVKNPTYGYDWVDGELIINTDEAKIVRRMYESFLEGNSRNRIADELNADGIKTKNGNNWTECGVRHILSNDTYAGNTLMQKYYTIDPIAKKKVRNKGEMPQYFAEGTHEAIIDKETFEKVQESAKLRSRKRKSLLSDCFSGIIKCENCGKSFHRTTDRDGRKR